MAKILSILSPDNIITAFAGVAHWGPLEPWDPTTVHAIWFDEMGIAEWMYTGLIYVLDLERAQLCAHTLAAMPMVARDICQACRNWAPGPTWAPRWNIYRGENRMATPPAIFWDSVELGPPPGYSYE